MLFCSDCKSLRAWQAFFRENGAFKRRRSEAEETWLFYIPLAAYSNDWMDDFDEPHLPYGMYPFFGKKSKLLLAARSSFLPSFSWHWWCLGKEDLMTHFLTNLGRMKRQASILDSILHCDNVGTKCCEHSISPLISNNPAHQARWILSELDRSLENWRSMHFDG